MPAQLSSGSTSSSTSKEVTESGELVISKLVVYPIKSCAGMEVEESPYSITGLDYDRQWMMVDLRTKKMVTARNELHAKVFTPRSLRRMAVGNADMLMMQTFLIQPSLNLDNQILTINIPGHGDFDVPIDPPADAERLEDLQVWGSYDLQGFVVSPQGSKLQKALSDLLQTPVLLIKFDKSAPRVLDSQKYLADLFSGLESSLDYPLEDCTTYFSDGYPFLLASEASFKAVGTWLEEETVDSRMDVNELVKRYRPNIVVTGNAEPFAEDSWEEITVGSETIFPVSRCQRCPVSSCSQRYSTGREGLRRASLADA